VEQRVALQPQCQVHIAVWQHNPVALQLKNVAALNFDDVVAALLLLSIEGQSRRAQ
jgi:hypothetical protein